MACGGTAPYSTVRARMPRVARANRWFCAGSTSKYRGPFQEHKATDRPASTRSASLLEHFGTARAETPADRPNESRFSAGKQNAHYALPGRLRRAVPSRGQLDSHEPLRGSAVADETGSLPLRAGCGLSAGWGFP